MWVFTHYFSSTSDRMASNYFLEETSNQIVAKVLCRNEDLVDSVRPETSLFSQKS